MLKTMETEINIGVSEKNRKETAEGLSKLLADTYAVYLMTQNFHWNVTGPFFPILQKLFEEQYQQLLLAVDTIAERIRELGFVTPATFSEFVKRTSLEEKPGTLSAEEMIRSLIEAHETVDRTLRHLFSQADDVQDQATADLLAERMEAHEKTAWMLRSSLLES